MFMLVEKLLADVDGRKECGGSYGGKRVGFFMLAGLAQISTITGTIECDFALLAAALWANPAMDCGTEALFLANVADGAAQELFPVIDYPMRLGIDAARYEQRPNRRLGMERRSKVDFCGLFWFQRRKSRIKCGQIASFPQGKGYKMNFIAGKFRFHNEEDSWLQA